MAVGDKSGLQSLTRRSALLGGLSLVVVAQQAMSRPRTVQRVLFICQYGTAKSAIARELFRRRARQRRIELARVQYGTCADYRTRHLLHRADESESAGRAQDHFQRSVNSRNISLPLGGKIHIYDRPNYPLNFSCVLHSVFVFIL